MALADHPVVAVVETVFPLVVAEGPASHLEEVVAVVVGPATPLAAVAAVSALIPAAAE